MSVGVDDDLGFEFEEDLVRIKKMIGSDGKRNGDRRWHRGWWWWTDSRDSWNFRFAEKNEDFNSSLGGDEIRVNNTVFGLLTKFF